MWVIIVNANTPLFAGNDQIVNTHNYFNKNTYDNYSCYCRGFDSNHMF